MYSFSVNLTQHTPIIHFQHDQDGATLRATEMKPKLDRFLIEKLTNKNGKEAFEQFKENKIWKKWLVGTGEFAALNYKIKIQPNENEPIPIEDRHRNSPMYFGNTGQGEKKHFKLKDSTRIEIVTWQKDLCDKLEEHICQFFFHYNFGTRQDKGYGSFTVKDSHNAPDNYQFKFELKTDNWERALSDIGLFYKVLRSGINLINKQEYVNADNPEMADLQIKTTSSFYFKSLIFLYAKTLEKQWDKKTIKQTFLNTSFTYRKATGREIDKKNLKRNAKIEERSFLIQKNNYPDSDIVHYTEANDATDFYLDFKDIFGLSLSEEWKSYDKKITKVNAGNNSTPAAFSAKHKNDGDFVERFRSPLFFKPVKEGRKYLVYVSYTELPNSYKGQKFIIYDNKDCRGPGLCLKIPDNFLLADFFAFLFDAKKFTMLNHVDSKFHNKDEFKILEFIFSQLQTKLK